MDNKHYYTLNNFYRNKFNSKVFKISLDAGFTCPNKDGLIGYGGCIFCNGAPYIGNKEKDLFTQFEEIKTMLHKKWPCAKYIVYLEANSNTYANVDKLKEIYEPLIKLDNVIGINIGTRCDCLSKDVLEYLEDLNKRTFLTVELGLQSSHNKTLKFINRGHTKEQFTEAVNELNKRNIKVVAHIINGLPEETEEMMIETATYLNNLNIHGIKIHMMYIEKGTKLAEIYQEKPFPILSKEEYIKIVSKQLQELNSNIVIHRITGDPDKEKLITPHWLVKKFCVLNDIDKYLKEHDIYQGTKKSTD